MEERLTEKERKEMAAIKAAMLRECELLRSNAEYMAQYTPRKADHLLRLIKKLKEVVQHG